MTSPYNFAGMPVTISDHLPKQHVGHWIRPAHPVVRWLARYFKFSPWVWYPMYEEQAVVMRDRIVMSPRMWTMIASPSMLHGVVRSDVV